MRGDFVDQAYDEFVTRSDPAKPCPKCGELFLHPNYPGIFECSKCGTRLRVEFKLTAHVTEVREPDLRDIEVVGAGPGCELDRATLLRIGLGAVATLANTLADAQSIAMESLRQYDEGTK